MDALQNTTPCGPWTDGQSSTDGPAAPHSIPTLKRRTNIVIRRFAIPIVLAVLIGPACGVPERAQPPALEEGRIGGAPFRIQLPEHWNGDLVLYAHGYQSDGRGTSDWRTGAEPVLQEFLGRGYGVAWSDFRRTGWAVEEGVEDTEALRRYFTERYGRPGRTFITGHSMGALIAIALLEQFPDSYDGALPLCGPLSPALDFLGRRVFDMVVLFEYFFPGSVGSPVDLPEDVWFEPQGSEAVRAAVLGAPERAAAFARRFELSAADLPSVLSFYRVVLKELQERAGGQPFDNHSIIYSGFDDDAALNRGVARYEAHPAAAAYVRRHYTPTGRIADPVLALHTMYDPVIPVREANYYNVLAGLAGTQRLFAAQFVEARGHCAMTPAQTLAAFEALVAWVRDYRRPVGIERQ
jgi:pimeloyl-ACP methyl ester carboxylesterase